MRKKMGEGRGGNEKEMIVISLAQMLKMLVNTNVYKLPQPWHIVMLYLEIELVKLCVHTVSWRVMRKVLLLGWI